MLAFRQLLEPGPQGRELRGRGQRSWCAGPARHRPGWEFPEACVEAVSASTACTRQGRPVPPDQGTGVSNPAGDRQSSALDVRGLPRLLDRSGCSERSGEWELELLF